MVAREAEIKIDNSDDGIVTRISLNRPQKKNALSQPMLVGLLTALGDAESDSSRIVVLGSTTDGVFCSGFDINYLHQDGETAAIDLLYECFATIQRSSKIFVSFADGIVFGGGIELFLSCDLRLATPRTVFRMTAAKLSQVYRIEGLARVVGVVGHTAAAEMFLTARSIPSDEALGMGLLTRMVDGPADLAKYVDDISQGAPDAQRATKLMLRALAKRSPPYLNEAEKTKLEELTKLAHEGENRQEALDAFAAKREPLFK